MKKILFVWLILIPGLLLSEESEAESILIIEKQNDVFKIEGFIKNLGNAGGEIIFNPGTYNIDFPIVLKSNLFIRGKGLVELITLNKELIKLGINKQLNNVLLENIVISYKGHEAKAIAIEIGSLKYSVLNNIKINGYDHGVGIYIHPDSTKKPAENTIFNEFRNIVVNGCDTCVIYEGKRTSMISNNSWYNVTMRNVKTRCIDGRSWADSERWYSLYCQGISDQSVLIYLNSEEEEFKIAQIDRFHFYSPVIVYHPKLKPKNIIGIKMGKETMRNLVVGLISDKLWPNDIIQNNGATNFISLASNDGGGYWQGSLSKKVGSGDNASGKIILKPAKRYYVLKHLLRRKVSPANVTLTAGSNLKGVDYWIMNCDEKVCKLQVQGNSFDEGILYWSISSIAN